MAADIMAAGFVMAADFLRAAGLRRR